MRHIFGLCGDTSLPLYDALARLDHSMTHLLTRDERHAGYMADAYARLTGRVGVCEGPSGGGATYILPGVVEANDSSVPLLAITTDIATTGRGRFTLTELDQKALFRPLTKWNDVIDRAADAPEALRARLPRGRPRDGRARSTWACPSTSSATGIGDADMGATSRYGAATRPTARHRPAATSRPPRACSPRRGGRSSCAAAASVTSGAEAGAARSWPRCSTPPVATTITGQGAIAETHPLAVGVVGSNGGTPRDPGRGRARRPGAVPGLPRRLRHHRALALSRARARRRSSRSTSIRR